MQSCFASLLRVRTSLEMFASKYRNYKDFSGPLKVFSDPTFLRKLTEAEQIIAPLSEASYRLQRDENTLDIFWGFKEAHSIDQRGLIQCDEERWGHKNAEKITSSTQLAKFALYYYHRLIGNNFDCIRSDLMEWIGNSFTSAHPREIRFNKFNFWHHVKKENPASILPDLAIRVLSIAVNTAATERLFSELGMIQTPKRNKMTSRKAQDTQCIRQYLREQEENNSFRSHRFENTGPNRASSR
ncbi:Hypothetical protein PHPALM_239 [Phytophthora palmivora]|uniref:HAT C-terminal dimerisation domain-containing protein n=1 Tax=Phytophthora palmivora TaxID=4796 RepID=A0A2P4YVC9_9STRA|nr:Hypothetical protein PHPALM_239 [Phytophthora palmivora]